MNKELALKALSGKPEEKEPQHTVVLIVDGEEMTDPMEIMEFIMDNKDMFTGKMKEMDAEEESMDTNVNDD